MMLRALTVAVLALPFLVGCAPSRSWQPAVDPQASRSPDTLSQDMYECQQLAMQASSDTTQEGAQGAVAGGALGAATGAAVGAATGGNAGTGAAVGAAVTGIAGMFKQGTENEARYRQAYRNCMLGRGHNVLN